MIIVSVRMGGRIEEDRGDLKRRNRAKRIEVGEGKNSQ